MLLFELNGVLKEQQRPRKSIRAAPLRQFVGTAVGTAALVFAFVLLALF